MRDFVDSVPPEDPVHWCETIKTHHEGKSKASKAKKGKAKEITDPFDMM